MIVACPNCATRYNLADEGLGEQGRTVRCGRCRHEWLVTAAKPARKPASRARPRQPATATGGARAGLLFASLLALLLIAAVVGRNVVAGQIPQAIAIYRMLGLDVTLASGLEFSGVTSLREGPEGHQTLVVSGEIRNLSGEERHVPAIRVALTDAERHEVGTRELPAQDAVLAPDATTRFEARIDDPPATAASFRVTFVDPS